MIVEFSDLLKIKLNDLKDNICTSVGLISLFIYLKKNFF